VKVQSNARVYVVLAVVGCAFVLLIVYVRSLQSYAPKTAPATRVVYPQGIVPFPDEAAAARAGIYAGNSPESCCFLAQTTTLRLKKPAAARAAIFAFYVPALAPFAGQRERVRMAFDGIPSGSAELSKGENDVAFAFPQPLLRETNVEAFMTMSIVFVPKEIGLNDDPRRLSVVLLNVSYK
jgi:hypothetical protein